jgi:aldose 1-epimerase
MVAIEAPDRDGRLGHVLLGFDSAPEYAAAGGAFGALLGRTANRIAGGRFTLDGSDYSLVANEGTTTLHGGKLGFDKLFWTVEAATGGATPGIELRHDSPDGDQGFPGAVTARALYRLDGDTLTLELSAVTTAPTIVNLSAHPYFNLAGAENGDVLGHEMTIPAELFLPTDDKQIPTGALLPVAGTPFDFRQAKTLGARIRQADPQLLYGAGYDQCFVLTRENDAVSRLAARVRDPVSGRVLEVHTTQPSVQVYTGNKLNGTRVGRGGIVYRQSAGLALEPQGFPDAPHHANFPSTVLRPGESYHAIIRYRFTCD